MIRNAVYLLVLLFFAVSISIFLSVIFNFSDGIAEKMFEAMPSVSLGSVIGSYYQIKEMIILGIYVLLSVLVFLTLMSSLIYPVSLSSYLISAIGGLISTPIVIYIASEFWNRYALLPISTQDFAVVFAGNFGTIMFLNLVFGLVSFAFVRRRSVE